tara:strand:- start:176 stop:490 length:315 start_codon:yes stop_codon:yes gene_type:complete
MMIIEGEVIEGMGLARQLGFPTINVTNDLKIEPNLYLVNHKKHGKGSAIVMKNYCEIHFLDTPENVESHMQCEILDSIFNEETLPSEGRVLRVLYDGIMNERKR